MPIGMTERMLNFNISFQIKELAPYILHPKWPMTLGFLYFYVMNLSINPLSYYHYWYSIRPSLESKSLSKLTAEYFWHDHSILFETFLALWYHKISSLSGTLPVSDQESAIYLEALSRIGFPQERLWVEYLHAISLLGTAFRINTCGEVTEIGQGRVKR